MKQILWVQIGVALPLTFWKHSTVLLQSTKCFFEIPNILKMPNTTLTSFLTWF